MPSSNNQGQENQTSDPTDFSEENKNNGSPKSLMEQIEKYPEPKLQPEKSNGENMKKSSPPTKYERENQIYANPRPRSKKLILRKGKNSKNVKEFEEFNLEPKVVKAIDDEGYEKPTLIQQQAISPILKKMDVLGIAKTGSGKTAAFALPILHNLMQEKQNSKDQPKILILSPTRELAVQIGESFDTYGKYTGFKQITIYGGVSQKPQVRELKSGVQIVVATPGRLLDLINQEHLTLDHIQTLVIDEADRMFDMGFIPDIKRIIKKIPEREQTLLFSATMPQEILDLAKSFLKKNFVHVTGDLQSVPVNKIDQKLFVLAKQDKFDALRGLLKEYNIAKALVFTSTKYGADRLVGKLRSLSYRIEVMHGDKSQNNRERVLNNFKEDKTQIVVATDLAARGLDVDDITHVINFDLPPEPETYMHRIGRTARAGKTGIAISLCAYEERKFIPRIERMLGFPIEQETDAKVERLIRISKSENQTSSNQSGQKSSQSNYKGKKRQNRKPSRRIKNKRRS